MNINCMNNKIENANGDLQPIILQAIMDIYLNGNHQMTARMVKVQCIILDANRPWNKRLPAICNAMRNSIECGGVIVGEDRNFNDFTIAFGGNGNNKNIPTPKSPLTKENKKSSSKNNKEVKNNFNDKKIDPLLKSLNWDKLKNKKTPKLLIISCCDTKSKQPNNLNNAGYINYDFGVNISNTRIERLEFYQGLQPDYFYEKERNGELVDKDYFMDCLNINNRSEALDVYGSNRSPFYKTEMKDLYRTKIANSNLHLLIISGLYGIIKHSDYINDYHLNIDEGLNLWGNELSDAIHQYQEMNNIDNDAVFYSLSNTYLPYLNPVCPQWNNLWINQLGHGHNQASDLSIFLEML